jgi:hypothetical protein
MKNTVAGIPVLVGLMASGPLRAGPLAASDVAVVNENGARIVIGTAVNQSGQNLPFAAVQFELYDKRRSTQRSHFPLEDC